MSYYETIGYRITGWERGVLKRAASGESGRAKVEKGCAGRTLKRFACSSRRGYPIPLTKPIYLPFKTAAISSTEPTS
jgi:hypothetical protein